MKILLADDHALFREGLLHVLKMLDDDVTILEAENFTETLEILRETTDFDLALIDLLMPGANGFQGLKAVKEAMGDKPVVVVSALEGRNDVLRAMEMGAAGYIPKTLSSTVLVSALKLVLSGGVYLPTSLLDTANDKNGASSVRLTPRQHDVLLHLAKGRSNKEIGQLLNLAEGTVKLHVTALMKNMGVNNRTKAVVKGRALGLFREDDTVLD